MGARGLGRCWRRRRTPGRDLPGGCGVHGMIEVYCRCEGDDSNSENLDFFILGLGLE